MFGIFGFDAPLENLDLRLHFLSYCLPFINIVLLMKLTLKWVLD